jgi:hypothetical protein
MPALMQINLLSNALAGVRDSEQKPDRHHDRNAENEKAPHPVDRVKTHSPRMRTTSAAPFEF